MSSVNVSIVVILGFAGLIAPASAAPAPRLPRELKKAIQVRADRARRESMQGTALCGGDLDVMVFAGDLSSGASPADASKAGATFTGWRGARRVASVKATVSEPIEDPCAPGVTLFKVEIDGKNPCGEAPLAAAEACEQAHAADYTGRAVAVPGAWGDKGQYLKVDQFFTLACATSGVIAKCAHWRYRPWDAAQAPLHHACVRAARADYCGTDEPITVAGTLIDLFDRDKVHAPSSAAEPDRWRVESDWSEDGATCLDVPRLVCCTDKVKLAAAIRKACGRDLPACKADCPPDAPTCGSPIRTRMTEVQPRSSFECPRALVKQFCR